jgi:quercetin dioxygenase-like cupin family protein
MPLARQITIFAFAALLAGRALQAQTEDEPVADEDSACDCAAGDSVVLAAAIDSALQAARGPRPPQPRLIIVDPPTRPAYLAPDGVRWQTVDLGGGSRLTVAALQTAPGARVQQLLLRLPANALVPAHWHSSGETLVVIRGGVTIRDASNRLTRLGAGAFTAQPAAAAHSLAADASSGALLLITSDGPWDVHLPDDAPGAAPTGAPSAVQPPR